MLRCVDYYILLSSACSLVCADEDEVMDQVSSLKKSRVDPHTSNDDNNGLGVENGSFKWNAVEEQESTESKTKTKKTSSASSEGTIAETDSETNEELTDHRFELRDISVRFPDRKLSCITSPTTSGKTTLLVCSSMLTVLTLLIIRSDGAPRRNDPPSRMLSLSAVRCSLI
jgi:hypothetical protein